MCFKALMWRDKGLKMCVIFVWTKNKVNFVSLNCSNFCLNVWTLSVHSALETISRTRRQSHFASMLCSLFPQAVCETAQSYFVSPLRRKAWEKGMLPVQMPYLFSLKWLALYSDSHMHTSTAAVHCTVAEPTWYWWRNLIMLYRHTHAHGSVIQCTIKCLAY